MDDVTGLLLQANAGDAAARDRVFELLYRELSLLARARLRRGDRVTAADTGALVHECWLKLQAAGRLAFRDRQHFLAYAASAMRSIVVDMARRSAAEQRGGDVEHVAIDTAIGEALGAPDDEPLNVLRLDAALADLAALDPRLARVVEMRFFAGLTEAQIAEALDCSERTVRRDWEKAKAVLVVALRA